MKNAIKATKIVLPNVEDMTAWACIACDQFTSEHEYWDELYKLVGDKPSVLNLVLPEIFLDGTEDKRIEKINTEITNYLKKGILQELKEEGFILTVRKTPYVERRIGLLGALDLEGYEYSQKNQALVRATEGTIEERIPPRLKIRKNAEVEFPHVMVLFDDEKREITEKLYENRDKLKKVYDFELNMGGGEIQGYFVDKSYNIEEKFYQLLDEQRLVEKYGKADKLLFAVGDGNHSLATAKTHWEKVKVTLSEEEKKDHPCRYALVEFVNIYDEGIYFEPIFRLVTGVDTEKFLNEYKASNSGDVKVYLNKELLTIGEEKALPQKIRETDLFIKEYISKNGGTVDYIHGEENLFKLVDSDKKSVGILFEKLDKKDLFRYVSDKGSFPRKTFSMGEGVEKRYYLEGRKIIK